MCAEYKISKNDCIEILRKHLNNDNFEILEFYEKSVIGEVVGIMAGHYKLIIKTKTNDKIVTNSFFVKKMQSPYDTQTLLMKLGGAYEKENFVYNLLKQLYEDEKNYVCDFMANCYLTIEKQLFVFEDVTENGYQSNPYRTLDLKHLKVVLDATAKFHAGSIIYEHRQSARIGRKYKITDDFPECFKDSLYRRNEDFLGDKFYKTCVKTVLALINIVPYYKNNSDTIKANFLKQVDRVYDLVKPSEKFLNVICHGDLWNSNLLFKYDKHNDNSPVHCKVVDFQFIRYTVPAHDYLYIVHLNDVDSDGRNNKNLSNFYYSSLKKYLSQHGVDINKYMTYDQFLMSVDYIYPFIKVQTACFANLSVLRLNETIAKSDELFTKCCYEDRSEFCIEAYHNNEIFRKLVDQSLKYLDQL